MHKAKRFISARRLIYVPIVHTQADMGSLSSVLQKEFVEKFGLKKWGQHVREIDEMWDGLKNRLDRLNLDWSKVRLYQDGLPVCGKEIQMVKDLAAKGSKNYALLSEMIARGAKVEGTEDPALLLEEYHHLQKIARVASKLKRKKEIHAYQSKGAALLAKRDTFIKQRIEATLKEGETGILFIGLLHKVDEELSVDIHTTFLIYRLPFKRQFELKEI